MLKFTLYCLFFCGLAKSNRRIGDPSSSNFANPTFDDYYVDSMELPEKWTPRMRISTIYPGSGSDELQTTMKSLGDSGTDGMTFNDFVEANICKANIARLCFDDADKNGDGIVTNEELRNYQREAMNRADNLYSEFQRHNFALADLNGDGEISRNEAAKFAQNELKINADADFERFFQKMDKNGDEMLDRNEFYDFLDNWYRNDSNLHVNFNDYTETTTEMDTISTDETPEETPIEYDQ
ncbi:unnamed protein product, partial [Mesorhabditis belari]|uniref:EF-hand domain-containing protein n=1 Tax=Mesorhabditis belari TaxID=2138241 RepID=A0AAF3J9N3_9BILA